MGSLILAAGMEAKVPAGMALGVDREKFSAAITKILENHPRIQIKREVIQSLDDIPRPAVIATGPLTDEPLAMSMRKHFDDEFLYFFDAIAPIIETDSINQFIAFKADRWDKGDRDYFNCPLDKDQYFNLINEIKNARKVESKERLILKAACRSKRSSSVAIKLCDSVRCRLKESSIR
jgi:methylenetetrahydrofolate--tRNA-(uracil-5-)-methyltransferase